MKLISLFMLFLFFSAFFIISNENLALHEKENRVKFAKVYYAWFLDILGNFKSISGYVIKAEWLPDNKNISSSTANIELPPLP